MINIQAHKSSRGWESGYKSGLPPYEMFTGPGNSPALFQNYTWLTAVPDLDYSKIPNLNLAFAGCTGLVNIQLPTPLPVKLSVYNLFSGCTNLLSVNAPEDDEGVYLDFDVVPTEHVSYSALVKDCTSLRKLSLTIRSGGDSADLAANCTALTTAEITFVGNDLTYEHWPEGMHGPMFTDCTALTSVKLNNYRGANTYDFGYESYAPLNLNSATLLSATALNELFTSLGTVHPDILSAGDPLGYTLYIARCAGAATCNPAIATAKGWVVDTTTTSLPIEGSLS